MLIVAAEMTVFLSALQCFPEIIEKLNQQFQAIANLINSGLAIFAKA